MEVSGVKASTSRSTIKLEVTRYRPSVDSEPHDQSYEIPCTDDMVVLDALNYIKDRVDGTLSFRWSCHMGVCGSCGVMVNGQPKLSCAVFLRDYKREPIHIEPLTNFPIIRDLVTDITDFMTKLKAVKPWIIRKKEKPLSEGEYRQSAEELERYHQFSGCINCMLCYSACPVYGLHPGFLGPAAAALAYRYNLDSRDQGNDERQPAIASQEGIWECTFVGECTVVCPKDVDPAAALQRSKVATAQSLLGSFILPRASGKSATEGSS